MVRKTALCSFIAAVSMVVSAPEGQAEVPAEVEWMSSALWGISHHYLAGGTLNNAYYEISSDPVWKDAVGNFDVEKYADLAGKLGFRYVIFTITQNRGYLATTSSVYDQYSPPCPLTVTPGCVSQPGTDRADYTPDRDLILDLATALQKKGVRLIAYLPAHVPDRWSGVKLEPEFPDWYISDFIREKSLAWGDKVVGWWFDGYYFTAASDLENGFSVARKMYEAAKAGNPNAVVTYSTAENSYSTGEPFSQYTYGENNGIAEVPSGGVAKGYKGRDVQWHTWTYLSQEDPVFLGWGQIKKNLRFSGNMVADAAASIAGVGGVSSWDVAINPDGNWTLDRLVQVQMIGNRLGTAQDTSYSKLGLVNDDDPRIEYDGDWQVGTALGHGEYNQDSHTAIHAGASFTYRFKGPSIVWAGSRDVDQGDAEVFLDGFSQGIVTTRHRYKRQVQEVLFERHDLSEGWHVLKVVNRSEGLTLPLDVIGSVP